MKTFPKVCSLCCIKIIVQHQGNSSVKPGSCALFRGHVMLLCYDNGLFSRSLHGILLVWYVIHLHGFGCLKIKPLQCVYVQLILYMKCCRQYLGSKPQALDLVFLFIVSLAAFHKTIVYRCFPQIISPRDRSD